MIRTDLLEAALHWVPLLTFTLTLGGVLGGILGWFLRKWGSRKQKDAKNTQDLADMKESIGELKTSVTENGRRLDAVVIGLLATHRKNLVDAYEDYVVNGDPLTVERRHEIDKQYEAYKTLGGNGTITRLYKEICHVPTHIVGEKEAMHATR